MLGVVMVIAAIFPPFIAAAARRQRAHGRGGTPDGGHILAGGVVKPNIGSTRSYTGTATGKIYNLFVCVDVKIDLNLTTRQTKEVKKLCQNRNRYRFIPLGNAFDFLPRENRKHDPVVFYPCISVLSDSKYLTLVTKRLLQTWVQKNFHRMN